MTRIAACALVVLVAANQRGASAPAGCPTPTARVWSPIAPAVVKTRVAPKWPFEGRLDIRAVFVLDAWIDEKGNVTCAKLTRSIPVYDQAAIDAVRQWKFTPATLAGTPVAVVQQVVVTAGG